MQISQDTLKKCVEIAKGNTSILEKESLFCRELFSQYFSDANSSTIRELITLSIAGYDKIDTKHGADGVHQTTKKLVECKPQFIDKVKNGKRKCFGGGGFFNDYTYTKIEQCVFDDYDVLTSGFADQKIIFLCRFPYKYISEYLTHKLDKKLLENEKRAKNGKQASRPSISFSFTQYKNCPNLEVLLLDKDANQYLSKENFKLLSNVKPVPKRKK